MAWRSRKNCLFLALMAVAGCSEASAAAPRRATARVVNASRATECAEEDNVYVKLSGQSLRSLRVEARHPSYMRTLEKDSTAPDFSNCNFDGASHPTDPRYTFEPRRVTLWESDRFLLVGHTLATFWRKDEVDFVVAGKAEKPIHLVQLFLKDPSAPAGGGHEFLVLYPTDGYWRAKPIPTLLLNDSVYGTSFLVGPVQEAGRPVVELSRVEFVPATMSFELTYEDGSHGQMRLGEVSRERVALDYTHDRALPSDKPLAAIRSMFVTPEKADAAEVWYRPAGGARLLKRALPTFSRADALEVAFGRSVVSKHNSSAPDMWFGNFER